MTLASLFLVVLASLVHACWNLLAKRAADVGPIFVFAYNLIACAAYAPWAILILIDEPTHWSGLSLSCFALSGVLHLAYSLCLQRGYQKGDLSVVYPVARGVGPALSAIGAVLILGERPTPVATAGLVVVVAGIVLIATQGDIGTFRKPRARAGLRWGAATGGLIASYTVIDAYAVRALGLSPVVLDWASNLMRFVLLLPIAMRRRGAAFDRMKGAWLLAIGVGLLSPLSYILVLAALSDGAPLSIVAPMREMSMMIGALMGMLILREPVGLWRLIGCAVLIAGVVLLSQSDA